METIGMDVVRQPKSQYARVLKQGDWPYSKEVSEYYLRTAATLKTAHIRNNKKKLLLRNAQKRLYLGIGCELLLKSLYLHHGFCINKFQGSFAGKKSPVHKLTDLADSDIDPAETFTMRKLIDNLPIRVETNERRQIQRGMEIAMTFRNKEGHISFRAHEFDHTNYRDLAEAVKLVFREGFGELLEFKISMKKGQKGLLRRAA